MMTWSIGEFGAKPWSQGELVGQAPVPFQMKVVDGVELPLVFGFCPGNTGGPPKISAGGVLLPRLNGTKLNSGWSGPS